MDEARAMETLLRPLRDCVLVRLLEAAEKPLAGVTAPDTGGAASAWAEVVAVGPGLQGADGAFIAPAVVKGGRVSLRPGSATEIALERGRLAIVSEQDILAVAERPAAVPPAISAHVAAEAAPPPGIEPVSAMREESLETDVAPSLIESAAPTAEDLH